MGIIQPVKGLTRSRAEDREFPPFFLPSPLELTSNLIFSCPWSEMYTTDSLGSQDFRLELNYATGCPGLHEDCGLSYIISKLLLPLYIYIHTSRQMSTEKWKWESLDWEAFWCHLIQSLHFPPLLCIASTFSAFTHFPGFVVLSISLVKVASPPSDASLQSSLRSSSHSVLRCMAPSRGQTRKLSGSIWHYWIWDPHLE